MKNMSDWQQMQIHFELVVQLLAGLPPPDPMANDAKINQQLTQQET